MLSIFSSCDHLTKTSLRLFQSFCLSLYGCPLWKTSQQLRSLETTFTYIFRKIWMLLHCCHTAIHHVSSLHILFNVIIECSQRIISQALKVHFLSHHYWLMCLEKASSLHIPVLATILCMVAGTGRDTRKLTVYVHPSLVM